MILRIVFSILLLAVSSNFSAAYATPKDSFKKINNCIKKADIKSCKDLLTADSHAIYDRFVSYNLIGCLPKDAEYLSEEKIGSSTVLKASVTDYGKNKSVRLIFLDENGKWKLSVPESLYRAMGENWEKQVNMIEQIYIVMKQQMGEKLDCNTIRGLARKKK